ncbi:ABC transporter substrate-binding protein [Paenibacillus sp.]|uniref:ABC transporter substrate-binding protein n=1 Tax=Paenibacillus sp. TaxID=58172 RepID=UPI00281206A5|nr:ABC transporter substrate-binding protein [Paenibacillus sp.]
MKSRKSSLILLSTTLILSMLAACSGGAATEAPEDDAPPAATPAEKPAETPAETPAEAEKEPVTIQFWHIYSDGDMKTLMEEVVNEFEAKNPHITVEELGVSFWDYWTKLTTAVAGGSGPDLALNEIDNVGARAKSGTLVNLDPFISRDNFDTSALFPVLVEQSKYEGASYHMPFETDVRLLYYNKAAFREAGLDPEKPPATWEELASYAEKLTKMNGDLIDRIGFSPALGNMYLWTLAWTNGGDFWDDSLKPTFTKPENVEALQWMADVQAKYGNKAFTAFKSQTGSLGYNPFIAEKVAMIVDNNTLYGDILRNNPNLEFGVAPIPARKSPASWSAGFSLEIIDNKDEARANAAWELMKYLLDKDVQIKMHKVSRGLYSNIAAVSDPQFMNDPIWKTMVGIMDHTRFREYVAASPAWANHIQPQVEAVLLGEMAPEEALKKAQELVETELKNFAATQ